MRTLSPFLVGLGGGIHLVRKTTGDQRFHKLQGTQTGSLWYKRGLRDGAADAKFFGCQSRMQVEFDYFRDRHVP